MPIPRDTMSLENFQRSERGLPPIHRKHVKKPDPTEPKVDDLLKIEDIPALEISDFCARGRTIKNEDGMRFVGFDIYIKFQDESEISGWALEGTLQKLKSRIPRERIDLLQKIAS